ncbi:MAG: hypothetical protein JWL67_277 [Solirubrobacterales bacterium]|nr:hypothetical protein [Solirubrobacterales bacterium]
MAELVYQYSDEWRYERFIATVEQLTGLPWTRAERAARATMETLGERITMEQARTLAEDLPVELKMWLTAGSPGGAPAGAPGGEEARRFDVSEFVRRVAEREEVDNEAAEQHVRAVFVALARLVRSDEMAKLAAQLPQEYRRLIGEAKKHTRDPGAPALALGDVFIERVARRAALEPPEARRASEAVMETLAERIAGGEVDDLAEQLPEDLHPALERGKASTGGKAQKMSLDEFIERVADREGVSYEQALEHARAVFAALRDTITDKEFSDLLSELPRGYRETLL